MTPHQRQVVDYFDQTHDDYRRLWGLDRHLGLHCGYADAAHRRHDDTVAHMNRVLAEAAAVRPTDHVLDAGCGIGGSALWLATHLGCRVTGISLSARQIEYARQFAARRGVGGLVDFHVADYAATGLPAAAFDVVWALESLCHGENKPAMLREAYRLLRPGGRLVVADCFLAREALSPTEQCLVERWQRGWVVPNLAGVGRFQEWLKDAGFHDIRFRDSTPNVAPSSRRVYLLTLLFGPFACLLYALGLRTAVQTRGILSGYYQYRARRRGLGVYGIFTATR
jgi:cyclopropane fatty-acyl-phospholipid synthase-like methyltransferase